MSCEWEYPGTEDEMRLTIVALVCLLSAIGTSCQTKQKKSIESQQTTCYSISQHDIGDDVPTRLLQADLPAGAKLVSVGFRVRLRNGGTWQECRPGTTCNGAILPRVEPGAGDVDGATVFG